jgi:hypothetical protein
MRINADKATQIRVDPRSSASPSGIFSARVFPDHCGSMVSFIWKSRHELLILVPERRQHASVYDPAGQLIDKSFRPAAGSGRFRQFAGNETLQK